MHLFCVVIVCVGAVRNCMSKTYEQRQLVEPRDWENSSQERLAIGPRKGNNILVNLDAAWCLDCGADARLAHFDCTGCMLILRRPRLCFLNLLTGKRWKLQAEVSPPNSAIGRRLDGDWTAIGRVSPVRPCPSELRHFLPVSRYGWSQRLR